MPAARALREAGFVTRLEDSHWLAKATMGEHFVDLIYGMGNGVARIDEEWIDHSRPGILAATPVQIAPAEELIWHRLFIGERHRHDMSDVVHLILCVGDTLDWERLVRRTGDDWPLLLAQLLMFNYVYPGYRGNVPAWVYDLLNGRAREAARRRAGADRPDARPADLAIQLHHRRPRVGFHRSACRSRAGSARAARDPRHRRR